MSKRIWRKGFIWCALVTLGLSQLVSLTPVMVQAAGKGVVINHHEQLPNDIKTEVKGTVNSVNDLSNGNVKVKLITKSEGDPKVAESMLLDGALQFSADSKFIVEAGNPTNSGTNWASFNPEANESLPKVRYTNVGTTKSGQKIDAVWEITKYRKPQKDSNFTLKAGNQGALTASLRNFGGIEYTIHLYKSGTSTPVDVLIFPAINDIDVLQVFQLSNATFLGAGSNIKPSANGLIISDASEVNGLADFPLGGAFYQYYGSKLNGMYNSKKMNDIQDLGNGFDIFGAYGNIKDIKIEKPNFGAVKIPKAHWEAKPAKMSAKDNVAFDFVQPINALDKDINHRYKNWETRFTLPKHLQDAKIELVDESGIVIPTAQKQLPDGRYEVIVTSEKMKKLAFDGETYHFQITGKISEKIVDQSPWTLTAETTVDDLKDKVLLKTKPIANKVPFTLTYTRKGTKDEVAKTKELEFGYGKPWDLKASTTVKGYVLEQKDLPVLSGKTVDFQEKKIDLFYIPRKQNLKVNYLLEDGTVLGKQDVPAFYHETYGTSASDIDDMYALMTEKLPKNAAGYLKSENETINYYYRKTKGYWVELNYGAQAITRLDYRGNIRSNSINYNDGEVITLINGENKSLLVHHDTVSKGAMSQQKLLPGKSVTVKLLNDDTVTVSLGTDGKATIVRQSASYQMTSEIQQGNWVNSTAIYDWQKTLVEEQITKVNGVSGQILSRFTKQYTDGLVATSNVVTNGNVKPNTTAKDAPATTFKRSVKLAPEKATAEQRAPALALAKLPAESGAKTDVQEQADTESDQTTDVGDSGKTDEVKSDDAEEAVDEQPVENLVAEAFEPELSFEDSLDAAPINKATAFDASTAGDIVDDKNAMQGLTNQHEVSVYDGDKLLKSGTVATGEKLMLEKEEPIEKAASDNTPSDAQKLPEQPTNGPLEVSPEADGNMTTREPGAPTGKTSGQLPRTESAMTYWLTILGLVSLIIVLILGFIFIRGGKKNV